VAESRKARAEEIISTGKRVRFEDMRFGRYMYNSGYPVTDSMGRVTRLALFSVDITERKHAEEMLRKSEERYRMLVETMNEGLGIADENGSITYVNNRFCEMFRFSQDEMTGHPITDFLDKENQKIWKDQFARRRRGESKPYELTWSSKDGRKISTLISPKPIYDAEGHLKGSFAVVTDISELKQVEQALKDREKELETERLTLEETNTTLRVLLEKRERDREEFEQTILSNVNELVMPYVEKLKSKLSDEATKSYLNILESNLNDIISPFLQRLSIKNSKLTTAQIQVANLVKEGKTTKEISKLLNLSEKTIEDHRKGIRKKLGILGKNINLKSFLTQMQ
jgi:PAS domain S-box-containing protein